MFLKRKQYISLMVLSFLFHSAFASSPVTMLEQSANNLLKELSKDKAQSGVVSRLVYRHIIPKVDVNGMSRSVLGRAHWRKASKEQRALFSKNFTSLVVRTYSNALKGYSGEKVVFSPVRGGYEGKRFIKISSIIIRTNGQNIPITYSLVHKKTGWKIYDMSVEGVSLLQSYRSQFTQFLRSNSIDLLIEKLKTRRFNSQKV